MDKLLIQKVEPLLKEKWLQKVFTYLDDKNQKKTKIIINNIVVKPLYMNRKPDILNLLKSHLAVLIDELEKEEIMLVEKRGELAKLKTLIRIVNSCIKYQESHIGKLSKTLKYKIRRGFIINKFGRNVCQNFYTKLQELNIFDDNASLLFNPYTSLINIIEIYNQVNTEIKVDFTFYWNGGLMIRCQNGLIIYGNDKDKDIKQIMTQKENNNLLLNMIKRICVFNYLSDTTIIPRKVTIYWINFKKEIMTIKDDKDRLFTSSEINTGVTNGIDIIITRKEECLKTILHECCHLYDWDFKIVPKHLKQWFLDFFPIKTSIQDYKSEPTLNLFEAYTEWFASILEIAFRYGEKEFISKMVQQIDYTCVKCCQILKISNCQSINEFVSQQNKKCVLNQSTNIFSYFVLKLFFYWQTNILVNCLNEMGQFKKTSNNFDVIKYITQKCIRSKILLQYINSNQNKEGNTASLKMVI